MKTYNVIYKCESWRTAVVTATDEDDAKQKFKVGNYEDGYEQDRTNIELVEIKKEK